MEQLSQSQEDYLEAILVLSKNDKWVRVRDIAEKLSVKASSVTGALKMLSEKKLINYNPYNHITLTEHGINIAQIVLKRHSVLKNLLTEVFMLESERADTLACKIEHNVDTDLCVRFSALINLLRDDSKLAKSISNGIKKHSLSV